MKSFTALCFALLILLQSCKVYHRPELTPNRAAKKKLPVEITFKNSIETSYDYLFKRGQDYYGVKYTSKPAKSSQNPSFTPFYPNTKRDSIVERLSKDRIKVIHGQRQYSKSWSETTTVLAVLGGIGLIGLMVWVFVNDPIGILFPEDDY